MNARPVVRMEGNVTFGPSAAETVLEELGMEVNNDGYVVDKDTGEPVESAEGERVPIEDFGGVGKGSKIVVKDSYSSVSEYVEQKHGLR
ncbi:hypothetical protein [Halosimplex marinum]|uniref:hypothetical protein n=1 Tax=Halosimplex marinum TaxID=3396620 RepID=UPI003F54A046